MEKLCSDYRKMHKFLKILLLIIFLWALTLPWTLSYLSTVTVTNLQEAGRNSFRMVERQRHTAAKDVDKVVIGIVACGDKPLTQSIVLLKSVLLSSVYYGIQSLDAIIFADDEHLHDMDLQVETLKNSSRKINFRYEIHPVIFPAKNHDEWRNLFKPCASQRLFFHSALPHVNEILYLDVDTLVVGDLKKLWSKFARMSSEQTVGLVAEHETASIGWYNRFARHPYYPPYGLNTGVMLMNLTRIREQSGFDWEQAILNSYKLFKDKIIYGDQDLINIIFHNRPDKVYLLPCSFNFRADHCQYGLNCNFAASHEDNGNGIQIVHGSRSAFFNVKSFPLFRKLYQYFEKFEMPKNDYVTDIVIPFKKDAEKLHLQNKTIKSTPNCDSIGHLLFTFTNQL